MSSWHASNRLPLARWCRRWCCPRLAVIQPVARVDYHLPQSPTGKSKVTDIRCDAHGDIVPAADLTKRHQGLAVVPISWRSSLHSMAASGDTTMIASHLLSIRNASHQWMRRVKVPIVNGVLVKNGVFEESYGL